MTTSHKQEKETPEKPTEEAPAPESPHVPAEASKENQLQEQIDRLQEDLARARDQWMRAVAETENIRKRSQREQEETARYAVTSFARDMVSVLENLKRAAESIPAEAREGVLKTLSEGVDLTLKELLGIFERHGIARIDPINQKFDHNLHQAVTQIERSDVPPGTVVQVVQAGYVIHDRLLRPAMVAVSKPGETPKPVNETV